MARVVVVDQFGAPDVLHIVDEPTPQPAEGEVRIRIEAIGINRLDQMLRSGNYPMPVPLPHARLGCEGTGIVDAIGPHVDGTSVDGVGVGDAVIITVVPDMAANGTYAEYIVVPASSVIPRPAGVDPVTAAALWVAYSTAYGALVEKAGVRPGDHVLITAASSGVGLASIQVANYFGAVPIAVTRGSAKKDALLAAGAAHVIATDEEDTADAVRRIDIADAVRRITGAGVDIIIDSVLGPGLADLAKAAKPGGTVVTVGWLDPRPASFPMTGPLTIYWYVGYELLLDPLAVRRIAAFLGAGLRNGGLRPTVDTVFSLDDIADAHRYLEKGEQVGKIVVTV